MEDQDRHLWPFRSLSFRSKTEHLSKEKEVAEPAQKVQNALSPAEQFEDSKPSRRPSLRFNLPKNFERCRRLMQTAPQPIPQSQRDLQLQGGAQSLRERLQPDPPLPIQQQHPPDREPLIGLPINEDMSLVDQPAARNNGGPVRPRQPVIDLTSDDEEEDEYFRDAPELTHIKKERHEVVLRQQELLARMGDAGPAFGFAERAPDLPPAPGNAYVRPRDLWGDYDLDDDSDDALFAEDLDFDQEYDFQPPPAIQPQPMDHVPVPAPRVASAIQEDLPVEIMESRMDCVDSILTVFPGICGDYVSELYVTVSKSSATLIAHILDKMDKGAAYPSAKEKLQRKRKRDVDEDAEAARKYGALDRVIPNTHGGIRTFISKILSHEFPLTSMAFITATLSRTGYRLFSAYQVLEEAERTWSRDNPPYQRLKNLRKDEGLFTNKAISDYLAAPTVNHHAGGFVDHEKTEVYQELQAARRIRSKADACRAAERLAEIAEEENAAKAEAEGTMAECQCCYCDYPLNRMVHCDGETLHWFCRGCAKQTAEVEIGKSKYELLCMSTDKCSAGFSRDQRAQFLDDNIKVALERNEQEAMLRLAGIENLESCPFCPFAAEYPDVEVDREFRCQAPDCEKISCRLCRLESHIPKTCEEHAKDNGLSIRRLIEEAMSAAMIRKCNKCGTPFVKEEGCNKMTCTRNGCRNIQCYVCSKSCDYNHFNDTARGGKEGNCPLFESVEQRHDDEVKKAEKEALEKVLADHPEYTEEDLKVKMSDNVLKDDEARKSKDPRARIEALAMRMGHHEQALAHHELLMNRARLAAPGYVPAAPLAARVAGAEPDFIGWHDDVRRAARLRPNPAPVPRRQVHDLVIGNQGLPELNAREDFAGYEHLMNLGGNEPPPIAGGRVVIARRDRANVRVGHPRNPPAQQPAVPVAPPVVKAEDPVPPRDPFGGIPARERLRFRGRRNREEEVQNRQQAEVDALQRQLDGMREAAQRQNDPLRGRMGPREDARLVANDEHANNPKVDDEVPGPGNPKPHQAMMHRLAGLYRVVFDEVDRGQEAAPAPAPAVERNLQDPLEAARRRNGGQELRQGEILILENQRAKAVALGRAPPAPAAQQNPEDPHVAAQLLNQEYRLFHRQMMRVDLRENAAAQDDPPAPVANLHDPLENARHIQQQQRMQQRQLIRMLENGIPPVVAPNANLGAPPPPQWRRREEQVLRNRMMIDPPNSNADANVQPNVLPHQLLQRPPPYAENDVVMQDAPLPPPYLPPGRRYRIPKFQPGQEQQQAIANPPPPNPAPGPDINGNLARAHAQFNRIQLEMQNITRQQDAVRRQTGEQMELQLQAQARDRMQILAQRQEAEARRQAELQRQLQVRQREQQLQARQAQLDAQLRVQINAQQVRQYYARANGLPADGRLAFAGRDGVGIARLGGDLVGFVGTGDIGGLLADGDNGGLLADERRGLAQARMDMQARSREQMRRIMILEAEREEERGAYS